MKPSSTYDRVIEINPNNVDAWNSKGYFLTKLGKYEQAIACFDETIKLGGDSVLALNELHKIHSNFTFEYDKGLQESRRLLEIESNLESKVMVAENLLRRVIIMKDENMLCVS